MLSKFISALFKIYRTLNFIYMEINPLVVVGSKVYYLDLAAKIDETAAFLNAQQWGQIDFPAPFGRKEFPEEAYIRELDSKTGASLKLTILNHSGRVWTMVAGGGASVVYADTISDYGFGQELANYGEYSGAPSTEHTFQYAKTIIGLMTRNYDKAGKIFIIGGGIANFTDVAATFTGLIKALNNYQEEVRTVLATSEESRPLYVVFSECMCSPAHTTHSSRPTTSRSTSAAPAPTTRRASA